MEQARLALLILMPISRFDSLGASSAGAEPYRPCNGQMAVAPGGAKVTYSTV